MNKLFAIAVLVGAISAQQILGGPATGLDVNPKDIHHFPDEKKTMQDAVHRMHDKPAHKGLFQKKDHQKSKKPSHFGGIINKMKNQSTRARSGNRRLQATPDRVSVLKKMAIDHKTKKDFISARKAKAPLSAQKKEMAQKATKMKNFKKMKALELNKQKRIAILSKKFKMTPEGKIMKDTYGKPVRKN